MKRNHPYSFPFKEAMRKGCSAWPLFCTVAAVPALHAQEVLPPRSEVWITPPAVQEFQTNALQVFQPGAPDSVVPQEKQPFQAGPFTARPHFDYRFVYGNGIQRQPGESLKTAVHEISPGLLIDMGRNWALDYTPTWRIYSNDQFSDTLDHLVRLSGGISYGAWTFALSQTFAATSAPLIETGTPTDQNIYTTAISATYAFASKLSLDLEVDQNIVSSDQFSSYKEWSTPNWLNYQVAPRLDMGLGVGAGYVSVDQGVDMTYEALQGRVRWRPTDKISFQLQGGGEDRQFLQGGADDLIEPVYLAGIQYRPLEPTRLSLSAGRTVSVSYFQNEITEDTEVRASLNQRLLKKFYLNVGGAYHTVKYIASQTGNSSGRDDDYYSIDARLSYSFLTRGTISIFYQYVDNSSSQAGYSFSSNQTGFEIGYHF